MAGDVTSATDLEIAVDEPEAADVRELLVQHVAFARKATPPGHVHALHLPALKDLDVTFYSARSNGRLVGVSALKRLDASHAESKSMHTTLAAIARGAAECFHSLANQTVIALVSSFGSTSTHTITVSRGGLTWTRVASENGHRADPEVWTAYAASALSAAHVTATQSTGDRKENLAGDLERPCE